MALLHTATIALHVLFAAAWFGLGLALPSLVRAVLAGAPPETGRKAITAMNGSIVLFYVFAFSTWTIGMQGVLREQYNAWPYHTSISLGLVLVVVQFLLIWRGWKALAGQNPEVGRKRIAMGTGIGHAVWLTIFVLMYVGRGVVAV
ncbi:MAG: hypothetical protein AAF845_14465 [Bacteroidota bacterium]